LYERRGQEDGLALQDWVQAEAEVLTKNIMAPLYRKTRVDARPSDDFQAAVNSPVDEV